ncbi:SDR family NAD(P)-dependent oxidoreductase [Jhaorihella thermophila]
MTDLSGKTALVTGSVQGIGLAIAEELAKAGARIAVHGIAGDAQIEEVCDRLHKAGAPQAEYFPRRSAPSRPHRRADGGRGRLGRYGHSGEQCRHPAHRALGRKCRATPGTRSCR